MRISVVIPSSGRWALLEDAVASALAQDRPADDVLVVDNSPAWAGAPRLPDAVQVVHEDARGVVPARNRGLIAATGDVVAFLDDDCLAPRGWLKAIEGCFHDDAVVAAGGPVRPLWTIPPPRALLHSPRARSYLGLLDLGARRKPLDPEREHLVGGNLAIRRSALGAKRFVGVHPMPGTGTCAEDTEMARSLARRGVVLYEPEAWVEHRILPEKTRWTTLAVRVFCMEAANVRLDGVPEQRLSLPQLFLWEGGLNAAKRLGRLYGRWLAPAAGVDGDD
ncbi:MAG: glycosyltransferase family 2 protein [Elusimicrobia bacterium]|nr:glycosyltransferase family 2 protein [Elusimicrobiota bacterium]